MQLVVAGPQLTLLQLDDCLYLVRHDALQLRLEQMSTCNNDPAYITISNVNDIPCLTMASEHDVKVRQKNISAGLCHCSHATHILLLAQANSAALCIAAGSIGACITVYQQISQVCIY